MMYDMYAIFKGMIVGHFSTTRENGTKKKEKGSSEMDRYL